MIPARTVLEMTKFTTSSLARTLAKSGYTGCSFESAKFLGISNDGDFCYEVSFYDDGGGPEETLDTCRVFLTYNSATGQITAEY